MPTIDSNFCWGFVAGLVIYFWVGRLRAASSKVAESLSSKSVAPLTTGLMGCLTLLLLLAVPVLVVLGQGYLSRLLWLMGL